MGKNENSHVEGLKRRSRYDVAGLQPDEAVNAVDYVYFLIVVASESSSRMNVKKHGVDFMISPSNPSCPPKIQRAWPISRLFHALLTRG
jgi:hypothetical protein